MVFELLFILQLRSIKFRLIIAEMISFRFGKLSILFYQ